MMEFYMFINSSDNIETHPNNCYYDFTITLPKIYHIPKVNQSGQQIVWRVALCDINLSNVAILETAFNIAVMTDLVEQSYLKGGFAPVLRILPANSAQAASLYTVYYISTVKQSFSTIRIYLQELSGKSFPFKTEDTSLSCCLHFQATPL